MFYFKGVTECTTIHFSTTAAPELKGLLKSKSACRALEKKMALLNAEYKDEEAGLPKQSNKPSQGMFASLLALLKAPRRQLASITRK